MPRRPIIAANWKMNKTHLEAIQAVQRLSYLLDHEDAEKSEVVICPPFTALRSIQVLIEGDRLPYGLGAQNVLLGGLGGLHRRDLSWDAVRVGLLIRDRRAIPSDGGSSARPTPR